MCCDNVCLVSFSYSYDITGFPTIKYFPADNKDGEEVSSHADTSYPLYPKHFINSTTQYERGRELADFVKFLNDKCGTHRLPGGKLNADVR